MGKGSSKGHTPREAKDNLKSTQLLSVIDAISEGPVEGPVDGLKSVLLNSTRCWTVRGIQHLGVTVVFRAGEQDRHRRRDLNLGPRRSGYGSEIDTPIPGPSRRQTSTVCALPSVCRHWWKPPQRGTESVGSRLLVQIHVRWLGDGKRHHH